VTPRAAGFGGSSDSPLEQGIRTAGPPVKWDASFLTLCSPMLSPELFVRVTSKLRAPTLANASSIAAAGLGESVSSSISPVAIRMTLTALPITSAGRFSPRGPRGMFYRRGNL
jgi:hypothetical protein